MRWVSHLIDHTSFKMASVLSVKAYTRDCCALTRLTLVNVYVDLVVFTRIAGTS